MTHDAYMDHQPWRQQALCKDLDPQEADNIFFVTVGRTVKQASFYCAGCPVRRECLNYAILYDEEGFVAGTTKDERRHIGQLVRTRLYQEAVASGTLETRDFRDWGLPGKLNPIPLIQIPTDESLDLQAQLPEESPLDIPFQRRGDAETSVLQGLKEAQ